MKRYIRSSNNLAVDDYDAKLTDYYIYKDKGLYRNVPAGQFLDATRPTRVAGKYKVFVRSFPEAAAPYSRYLIADTSTGKVYTFKEGHGGANTLGKVVEALKEMQ